MPRLSPPSPDDLAMKQEYEVEKVGTHTIAKRRGLTSSKVVSALERARVKLRPRSVARAIRRQRELASDEAILAAYKRTRSTAATCRETRRAKATVLASLRRSGVPINPPGGRWKLPAERRAEIVEFARRRGINTAAKAYGLNRSTICYYRAAARRDAAQPPKLVTPWPCAGCSFPTTDGRLCDRCQIAA